MIPVALSHLPVASQIAAIDFDAKSIVAVAQTGAGKSLVLPPLEAMRRRGDGSCVLLRQPTRLTTTFVYSGIKHFWPDLKVGISTRDDKQNLDDADIIVFSDGSLSGLLAKRKVSAIYFDEAHLLPIAAELDLAIAKKSGARLRCLSATIDPAPMAEYLGGGAAVHHLEGRVYPIERSVETAPANVLDRNDHELLWGALDEHVQEAKFDDAGILVFLPTKQMCQEAAEHYESDLPTAFAHGEVRPTDTEAFCKKHAGSAYAIFATTAASAGITIDVEKVVILDEVIDSEVRMGVERQFATRVGDNALLQMAGRAGRIKPGRAVLITPAPYGKSDRDWADVAPRAVVGGCSKTTPFAVLMALAQHGIHRDSEVDLYSKLDPIEMKHARDELVAMRCLDGEGKLTRLGRLVQLTPLEPHMAHLVHTAPGRDAKIAVLAGILMSQQGTFQLVRQKPKEVGPGGILLPPECLHPGSAPMTLAHILQSYAALPSGSRRDWCVRSNLNERILAFTLRDYKAAAESLDDADASDLAEALDFDDADLRARVDAHVASHRSLRKIRMTGTWGKIWMPPPTGMLGCVLDSVLMQAWRAEGYVGHVAGIASIRKARSGSDFATLDLPILLGA